MAVYKIDMKGVIVRLFGIIVPVAILLMVGQASAQYLGQMSPASILTTGTGKIGGYFIAADNASAVVGSVRYGFSRYTEGRLRFGFIDEDGKNTDPHIILGVDAKYMLWEYSRYSGEVSEGGSSTYKNPCDLSIGGFAEYARLNFHSVLGLGGSAIASIPYQFKNNSAIEPYARLNLRYQRVEGKDFYVLGVRHEGESHSDFEIGLNVGALFSVTPLVDFTAEFQLDDETAFMLGIDIAAF